ncbi:MAG: hypothetical protein ABIA21_01045 [Candidatus Aenigmatarchaeota archaeon]
MKSILSFHKLNKKRIADFLSLAGNKTKNEILFELLFCLLAPQSKAPMCRSSLKDIWSSDSTSGIYDMTREQILKHLGCVRFNERKSEYMILARDNFDVSYMKILKLKSDPVALRDWLVDNIKGYGYKEATHFLRNIGLGEDFAMFDVHVLRFMQQQDLGDVDNISGRKRYLEYEQKFVELAQKHGLKPAELDIAVWLMGSGNEEIM